MAAPDAITVWKAQPDKRQEAFAKKDFFVWIKTFPKLPDTGKPPDTDDHPWFDEIYEALGGTKDLCFIKAPQVGITTAVMLYCLWGARYHWPKGFVYYLPQSRGMGDLVREKIDKIIASTKSLYLYSEKGVDNVGMKQIGRANAYFRGIDSAQNRKTIPVDVRVLDEFDDIAPEHDEETEHRMDASAIKRTIRISVPSLPGYGIDKVFQESTQEFWTMDCPKCGPWTVEEQWPKCVGGEKGARYLACPICKEEADIRDGDWVAKDPEAITRGFSINGLMNPHANVEKMAEKWDTSTDLVMLTRNLLGIACMDESGERLVAKQVRDLATTRVQMKHHDGATWLGVDVGKNRRTSRAVILDWPEDDQTGEQLKPRVVRLWSWQDEEELWDAVDMFHVERGVIDAGGEPRLSEKFCDRFPGIIYKCYYDSPSSKPGKSKRKGIRGRQLWNDGLKQVRVDRTESLDRSHRPLYTAAISLPSVDIEVRLFAEECQRLKRVTKEVAGNKWATWVKEGEEHYRHAFNYAWLAMTGERPTHEAKILSRGSDISSMIPRRARRPMS